MVNIGTIGIAAVVAKIFQSFRQACPVCKHPMSEHIMLEGRFQDR